jgi:hypothetical protein
MVDAVKKRKALLMLRNFLSFLLFFGACLT